MIDSKRCHHEEDKRFDLRHAPEDSNEISARRCLGPSMKDCFLSVSVDLKERDCVLEALKTSPRTKERCCMSSQMM